MAEGPEQPSSGLAKCRKGARPAHAGGRQADGIAREMLILGCLLAWDLLAGLLFSLGCFGCRLSWCAGRSSKKDQRDAGRPTPTLANPLALFPFCLAHIRRRTSTCLLLAAGPMQLRPAKTNALLPSLAHSTRLFFPLFWMLMLQGPFVSVLWSVGYAMLGLLLLFPHPRQRPPAPPHGEVRTAEKPHG